MRWGCPKMNADDAARILISELSTPLLPPLGTLSPGEWLGKARRVLDGPDGQALSSGEKVMIGAIGAIWNGTGDLQLRDLSKIDAPRQIVVMCCWVLTYSNRSGDQAVHEWLHSMLESNRRRPDVG